MANRYLVGTGAGNWNDPLIWSETSGGAGGATVPTSADAVILDVNSGTGTITLDADANCASFDASALTSATTIAGSVYLFNCYGSFTGNANLTFNLTGTSYFYSRRTGTITQGGATLGWNRWYIDCDGHTITHGDNYSGASIYFKNGTYNTSDKTLTVAQFWNVYSASGTRNINLGASVINVASWYLVQSVAAITLDAGTSTINCSGSFEGFGKTYYNVNLTASASLSFTGANTFTNLSLANSASITPLFSIGGNQTVTGTLTLTGNNATNYRLLVNSNTLGTPRTITCNGQVIAENVDFGDVTGAGTASWDLSAIPGGSGDCGGNSGIIFTPAQPQYYKHSGGGTTLWSDSAKWFSDESLTLAGRVPLPQDDANFIAGSFDSACILSVNVPRIGGLNMEGISQRIVVTLANSIECYGGKFWTDDGIIFAGSTINSLLLYSTISLKIKEVFADDIALMEYRANVTFDANFTSTRTFGSQYLKGNVSFDFNDYDIQVNYMYFPRLGGTRKFGNGTIIVNTAYLYWGQIDGEESTFIIKNGGTFNIDNNKFNILILEKGTYLKLNVIANTLTIKHLILMAGEVYYFTAGGNYKIDKLTATGTPSEPITITSYTTAPFNLVKSGAGLVNVSNCNISYSNATPNRFFAMDSVDGGNNTGWNFGQIGASPGEIGLSVIEDAEAEVIGEAILRPNFSEMEELGCQAFADAAILELSLSEAESMDADAFGEAVISTDFEEVEIMDADLKATAYASADFMEHEQAGDDHGVLRMFENIIAEVSIDCRLYGETSFSTDINSEGEIL